MKIIKILKISGIVTATIAIGLFIIIQLRQNRKFEAPYPEIKAVSDSNVIARGQEIVFGPGHCSSCHAAPEMEEHVVKGELVPLSGGKAFPLPIGNLYAKNLTPDPSGIANMTDGTFARALRYGVGADGRALFDMMAFHHTSDSDLVAIISYLRKQRPVKNDVPKNSLNMLGKAVNAFLLKPTGPTEIVAKTVKPDTTAQYGAYLANNVANCRGCHTNRNLMTGEFLGAPYAGGLELESRSDSAIYTFTTPNLTPDETGRITGWTPAMFIRRFRAGALLPQSHMPWGQYSKMSDDELKAIFYYLQTVSPVANDIKEPIRVKPTK